MLFMRLEDKVLNQTIILFQITDSWSIEGHFHFSQIPSCIPPNQTPGPSGSPVYLTAPTGKVTGYGTVTPTPEFVYTQSPTPRPGETLPPQLTLGPGLTYAPTPGTNVKPPTPMPKPSM